MNVYICDRCGDVTIGDRRCRCATAFNPVEMRRRHRDATARARATDVLASGSRVARRVA